MNADDSLEEARRNLRDILAKLQQDYAKAAKPYIDRLTAIEMMTSPKGIVIREDDFYRHFP